MKKSLISLFVMLVFLGSLSLYAAIDQSSESVSQLSQSDFMLEYQSIKTEAMKKSMSGADTYFLGGQSFSTHVVLYQYTPDGWKQHLGIYPECMIITNMTGPLEGTQFIKDSDGHIVEMCHSYTKHPTHFSNKYLWGEVNSYENYQLVTIR